MKGVDVVVHFAAESHVDRSIIDAAPFIKSNIEGTFVLLQAALKNKIKRFHHVSTDEVFGALPLDSDQKFTEDTSYKPHSPYAASKASSDHLVRAFHDTYGLPITISNCANNFGPFHFPEKLIPLAITNIMEGKKVPVYGDGLYVRDWLYVKDHCSGIESILQKGEIGETYLIGSMHEDIPNIEVIQRILKIMGKDESCIEYVKDRPAHDRRYAIDWSKIHNKLGWSPQYSFDDALEMTVHWYQNNEDWWKRVKSGAYKEYYKKQYGK
jgi:dTDP-glucose 4,6-dehydratase